MGQAAQGAVGLPLLSGLCSSPCPDALARTQASLAGAWPGLECQKHFSRMAGRPLVLGTPGLGVQEPPLTRALLATALVTRPGKEPESLLLTVPESAASRARSSAWAAFPLLARAGERSCSLMRKGVAGKLIPRRKGPVNTHSRMKHR